MDLLAIDDWGLAPLTAAERRDLLEILEDRTERAATLITSQIPVKGWHDLIGEPTLADAICDRLIHTAYVIELSGPSLRESRAKASRATPNGTDEEPPTAAASRLSGAQTAMRAPRRQNRDRVEAQEGAFDRGAATLISPRATRQALPGGS
jgi:IstB-like ATP binding protein